MANNTETLAATVAMTQGQTPSPDLVAQLLKLLQKNEQLTDLDLKHRQEEEAKKAEQKESARKLQLEGAKAMARQAEAEKAAQSVCGHRNDAGRAVIGGQRDHQHQTHYICLRCGKEWTGIHSGNNPTGLPGDLLPKSEFVGGPNQ